MLNVYILTYIVVTIACMFAMLYVSFRQIKEVRRPKNAFSGLRWRLLLLPLLIVASLGLGLPRLFENINLVFTDPDQVNRVISGILFLSIFTFLILDIYTYREKK